MTTATRRPYRTRTVRPLREGGLSTYAALVRMSPGRGVWFKVRTADLAADLDRSPAAVRSLLATLDSRGMIERRTQSGYRDRTMVRVGSAPTAKRFAPQPKEPVR